MFYQVKIGTVTRRGMFVTNVESVVSFDGSASELNNVMARKYEGFTVKITEIKEVTIVEKEVVRKETIRSKPSNRFYQTKKINSFFENSDKVLTDYLNAVKSLKEAKTVMFEEIEEKLKRNIGVLQSVEAFDIKNSGDISYVLILDGTLSIEN